MSTPLAPSVLPSFSDEGLTAPDPTPADALLGSAYFLAQELRQLRGHGPDHAAEMGLRRAIALLASAAAMSDDRAAVQRRSARVLRWLDGGPAATTE
jgi:hypothetical protein